MACACFAQADTWPLLKLEYEVSTLAEKLNSPWTMVPIVSGSNVGTDRGNHVEEEWLVTERDGHIVHIVGDVMTRHKIELSDVYVASQGGLLDLIKAPDFERYGTMLLSYAQGNKHANRLVVGHIQFNGQMFSDFKPILTINEDKNTAVHYGGRLLLLPDDTLLITTGDGYDFRERPQVLHSHMGKMLRIHVDGSIPSDNPYAQHSNVDVRAVYSYGHRNPQGLAYDPIGRRVFEHEHGPAGGDEINIIEPKVNYGWPIITYGKDYSGAKITPFTEYADLRQPVVDWTPSIAPSGMAYYYAEQPAFVALQRHLLVTTLKDQKLYAVSTADGNYEQFHVFEEITGRLRDVYVTEQGDVVVLTDGDDASLLKVSSPTGAKD